MLHNRAQLGGGGGDIDGKPRYFYDNVKIQVGTVGQLLTSLGCEWEIWQDDNYVPFRSGKFEKGIVQITGPKIRTVIDFSFAILEITIILLIMICMGLLSPQGV